MPFWTEPITHVGSLRLTTIRTRVRFPTHLSLISTGFLVGFKVTAFLFPLSRIDDQSLPRGRRFTSASEGQEFHLHENQVIKDLIGLCSSSLTTRVISRKRIALTRVVMRPSDQRWLLGALAASQTTPPRPTTAVSPAQSSAGRSPPIRTAGRRARFQSASP